MTLPPPGTPCVGSEADLRDALLVGTGGAGPFYVWVGTAFGLSDLGLQGPLSSINTATFSGLSPFLTKYYLICIEF